MPTIVLIRHGETAWSLSGQHTGRTDVPLTDRGRQQASALRGALAQRRFGLVLTSPLHRAVETAELAGLAGAPNADVVARDPDLLEWDYGAWEGRTTSEIRESLGDPLWTVWAADAIQPGATPGERPSEVADRVARVLARCGPVLAAGQDCALVAHGHVLRILTATWLGLPAEDGRLFRLEPATVSELGFEHEQRVICTWNTRGA